MEFNQLPEGLEREQKRVTEFDSEVAKLDKDAGDLIVMARESLQKRGVQDASKKQVIDAIETIVSVHRGDLTKQVEGTAQTLGTAIKAKLYSEEEQELLAQARSREGVRAEYEAFIDEAKLPRADALRLKEMMSEANYVIAVETAKEMKASKIPTYEQIARKLMTYTPERLRDICEEMEKPELVIESDRSFEDNIQAMDENPHYIAANGKPQENTYVNSESDSPYRNLNKPGKVKAWIVDGVPHPEEPEGVSAKLGERRAYYTVKFTAKNMNLIGPKANAALLQQSMKRAKAKGDNSLIVDNWKQWKKEQIPGTVTLIEPSELTESALVACSAFDSRYRQARFYAYLPSFEDDSARGRAAMQVLEI